MRRKLIFRGIVSTISDLIFLLISGLHMGLHNKGILVTRRLTHNVGIGVRDRRRNHRDISTSVMNRILICTDHLHPFIGSSTSATFEQGIRGLILILYVTAFQRPLRHLFKWQGVGEIINLFRCNRRPPLITILICITPYRASGVTSTRNTVAKRRRDLLRN